MKPHYFDQEHADPMDVKLGMAKLQGYVPQTCLLGGGVVMDEIIMGNNPCWSCNGPREKCHGKEKRDPAGEKL